MNKQALSAQQMAQKPPKQAQRKKNNAPKQKGNAQGNPQNQGGKSSRNQGQKNQASQQNLPKDPIPHISPLWVKNQAKAGNWRRGLEIHLSGNKIMNMDLEPFGIVAQVKGNYKSHYTSEMRFNTAGIDPRCNCAIEEKWCKHAVAIALSIAEQRLWEVYWNLPEEDADLMPVTKPMGILKVQLHLGYNKSKGVGVRLI